MLLSKLLFSSHLTLFDGQDRNKVSFYDPYFSEGDVKGLLQMGYAVSPENKVLCTIHSLSYKRCSRPPSEVDSFFSHKQRGRYTFEQKTLLFMPHCSVKLYENALRYNWNAESLRKILILGNTLGDYITKYYYYLVAALKGADSRNPIQYARMETENHVTVLTSYRLVGIKKGHSYYF